MFIHAPKNAYDDMVKNVTIQCVSDKGRKSLKYSHNLDTEIAETYSMAMEREFCDLSEFCAIW